LGVLLRFAGDLAVEAMLAAADTANGTLLLFVLLLLRSWRRWGQ
jgi:hypothetical protein